jgi:uncharacterized protein
LQNQETNRLQPLAENTLPWTVKDTWVGVALLPLIVLLAFVVKFYQKDSVFYQTFGIVALEAAFLIPVIVILVWRRANWGTLGFRKFEVSTLGLGCGLIVAAYAINLINNTVFQLFHIPTQGTQLIYLFRTLKSPLGLIVAGVGVAPFIEEILFRGFLFQGFRQGYGWNRAAIWSSLIFAVFHLQLAALIPTFTIGCVLSYVYHKSNSIWPGIILHFLINAFGLSVALAVSKLVH